MEYRDECEPKVNVVVEIHEHPHATMAMLLTVAIVLLILVAFLLGLWLWARHGAPAPSRPITNTVTPDLSNHVNITLTCPSGTTDIPVVNGKG
jgi:hypothetical protein